MPSPGALPTLIVDDDPGALLSLRFLLESEGNAVFSFRSGAELLASFPQFEPACIIIDYKMPAMDGIELFDRLRAMNVTAPVIVITGHPDPGIRTRVSRAGLVLIEKPFLQEVLLSAVRTASGPGVL